MRTGERQIDDDFSISRKFVRDDGLLAVGVCSDDPEEVDYIRVSSPIEYMDVEFAATKTGSPPTIPSPITGDTNLVALAAVVSPSSPALSPDSFQQWTVSGHYRFGVKRPRGVIRDMPTGKMPFDPASASENIIPSSFFVHNLLGDPNTDPKIRQALPTEIYQGITS